MIAARAPRTRLVGALLGAVLLMTASGCGGGDCPPDRTECWTEVSQADVGGGLPGCQDELLPEGPGVTYVRTAGCEDS